MTEAQITWLVHEAYAMHTILCNLGFEPNDVFVEVRPIANTQPAGPHVVVRLQRGELRFVSHLCPVTKKEGKRFIQAFRAFVAAKPTMPRDELDRILYGSQCYAQRVDILWTLTQKGFELRPGEMVN